MRDVSKYIKYETHDVCIKGDAVRRRGVWENIYGERQQTRLQIISPKLSIIILAISFENTCDV